MLNMIHDTYKAQVSDFVPLDKLLRPIQQFALFQNAVHVRESGIIRLTFLRDLLLYENMCSLSIFANACNDTRLGLTYFLRSAVKSLQRSEKFIGYVGWGTFPFDVCFRHL